MRRSVSFIIFLLAAPAITGLCPDCLAASAETVLHDEAKHGDLKWAKADSKPTIKISKTGVFVIRGTGVDALDDADAFVFEVTGSKPFDIAVVGDAAEFKKLRSIATDGKAREIAFGSTNGRFRAPRDIVKHGLPPGRYHVELLFGPQGAVGDWFVKIAPRDPKSPPRQLHKAQPDPTSAAKSRQVDWPGAISIYHGHNWGKDEKFLVAVKRAGYRAAGAAEYQIPECAKHGLRAFVFIWPHESPTIPPKYKNNKTVLCYYLSDRIPPSKWASWASLEKMCYKGDPGHPAIFTMRALWGGIGQFCGVVRGRAMEYYHYHWDANRSPGSHFAVLEQYRAASVANGDVPICRIVETRPEDMRKTRQTVYTSLAYGVRGYRMGGALFDTKKRDKHGVPPPNAYGKEITRLNAAINAWSPIFKHTRCRAVYHVKPLPAGCREVPKDAWFSLGGKEVLVGVFGAKAAAKSARSPDYLLVANRDAFGAQSATITIAGKNATVQRMDKLSAKWVPHPVKRTGESTIVKIDLPDGGGELLRVEDRSPRFSSISGGASADRSHAQNAKDRQCCSHLLFPIG